MNEGKDLPTWCCASGCRHYADRALRTEAKTDIDEIRKEAGIDE